MGHPSAPLSGGRAALTHCPFYPGTSHEGCPMDEPTPWPPRRRRLSGGVRVVLLAAALAVLGVIPLLGLPGALIVTVSLPVFGLSEGDLHPDASWPVAMLISLLWPGGLVLGCGVGFGLMKGQSGARKGAAMAGVVAAWCLLLALPFYLWAEKRKPVAPLDRPHELSRLLPPSSCTVTPLP